MCLNDVHDVRASEDPDSGVTQPTVTWSVMRTCGNPKWLKAFFAATLHEPGIWDDSDTNYPDRETRHRMMDLNYREGFHGFQYREDAVRFIEYHRAHTMTLDTKYLRIAKCAQVGVHTYGYCVIPQRGDLYARPHDAPCVVSRFRQILEVQKVEDTLRIGGMTWQEQSTTF